MKTRALIGLIVVTLLSWIVIITESLELMTAPSTGELYGGTFLLLLSVIIMPSIISRLWHYLKHPAKEQEKQ